MTKPGGGGSFAPAMVDCTDTSVFDAVVRTEVDT